MIAIIDYQAGNIGSVGNALRRLGVDYEITADPQAIKGAQGVIFPGQGRAGPALRSLRSSGLDKLLPVLTQPFLGICLGMQLMVEEIEEDNKKGLGIIPGSCKRFTSVSPIPHMGWNSIRIAKNLQFIRNIRAEDYFYFVHSYAVHVPAKFVVATTDYGGEFASVIACDNFYGVQFHPEKSADAGENVLKNFLRLCGEKL